MNTAQSVAPDAPPPDLQGDWLAWKHGGDAAARSRLIEYHTRLARILAAKAYARRTFATMEFDDYMQHAMVGLLEAVDRFDPERGIKFETFAAPRINGEILNALGVSSEVQEQVAARRRVIATRVESVREPPTPAQSADAVFASLARLAIGLAVGFALDDSRMYEAREADYPDNCYAGVEMKQLQQRVRRLVEELTGRERQVISYHYLQQLPFEEIARMLDLSKGRISQVHREALRRMQDRLLEMGELRLSF